VLKKDRKEIKRKRNNPAVTPHHPVIADIYAFYLTKYHKASKKLYKCLSWAKP